MTPLPTGGEVHIRLASLDMDDNGRAEYESFLNPEERERADRYLNRNVRNRFVAGRGFLRETLSRYLDVPPGMIVLALEEQGKPFLADTSPHSRLQFNLSHTGGKRSLPLPGTAGWV